MVKSDVTGPRGHCQRHFLVRLHDLRFPIPDRVDLPSKRLGFTIKIACFLKINDGVDLPKKKMNNDEKCMVLPCSTNQTWDFARKTPRF
jgi:hypothetical protein